jgi:hypothetical protein
VQAEGGHCHHDDHRREQSEHGTDAPFATAGLAHPARGVSRGRNETIAPRSRCAVIPIQLAQQIRDPSGHRHGNLALSGQLAADNRVNFFDDQLLAF